MCVNELATSAYGAIIRTMIGEQHSVEAIERTLERILPRVEKPGRYTGGELNSVKKDWSSVCVRLALAFPDVYELGMANLGLTILYDLVNRRTDMLAERVFSPWVDMEREMRQARVPLFSLESKRSIADFDVLGISLPYEQLYTNALNLLDLSGIPLLAAHRDHRHPLVIAGGHAMYNPEPMAPFLDAVAIGDGEEVLIELLLTVAESQMPPSTRQQLWTKLAAIPGVYVPSLYQVAYLPSGIVAGVTPRSQAVPQVVQKRIVSQLPATPRRPIVPFIQLAHDRAVVEVGRGCTRGCRFCQAGYVMRPVRERPVKEIVAAVDAIGCATGFGEAALMSLSLSDYSRVDDLIGVLGRQWARDVSISVPSLRIDSSSESFLDALSLKGRKGSLTFAPEAATDRLRNIINKPISDDQLLEATDLAFGRGWHTVKLYFMIGLPRETMTDVMGISRLAQAVLRQGQRYHGRRARVNLGVSTFIPKPHTPFQWTAVDEVSQIDAKHALLQESLSGRGLELRWNSSDETLFEGLLSRGDRRLAAVVKRAWELGDRFSAWAEHFDLGRWRQALYENNLALEFYTHRLRSTDELLPWDHINTGVRRSFLVEEYERSLRGESLPDCRQRCAACGILTSYAEERREVGAGTWGCP